MGLLLVKGRHGDWTATVVGLGDYYCCHEMFLKGDLYDQDCTGSTLNNRIKKKRQMEGIRQSGLVIITTDQWDRPPGDPGPGGRYRIVPYIGLFRAYDATYLTCHLRFRLGEKLANLIRPCDL